MAILLGGALTGVLAVCAIAGLFILKSASSKVPEVASSSVAKVEPQKQQQKAEASPSFTPFEVVPDACDMLESSLTGRLVPGSKEGVPPATSADDESRCSWGDFGARDPRELSVELRGSGSVEDSKNQFNDEWNSDRTGDTLISGQKLKYSKEVGGLGEAAYALYIVGGDAASGVINARVGNVLITIRYAGRAGEETPLSQSKALSGATEAAKIVVTAVQQAGENQQPS
ncbi:hypothetical protein [Actinocorallia longicatena]